MGYVPHLVVERGDLWAVAGCVRILRKANTLLPLCGDVHLRKLGTARANLHRTPCARVGECIDHVD